MTRVAIITGVSGGIGRATAQLFEEQGWTVEGIDIRDEPVPGVARNFRCDLADAAALERTFSAIAEHHPRVHALINNAAVQLAKPLLETSAEEWDRVLDTNARSVFLGIKAAFPLLAAARPSAVVNVSSVHAVATARDISAYAASKGAVAALTRAAAIELAEHGIRVNAVLPGAVDTAMLRAGLTRDHAGAGSVEARLQTLGERTVMGRVGRPLEIARMILFLASEEQSSFATGQMFVVDGGATSRLSTE